LGGETARWDTKEHLLYHIVDQLNSVAYFSQVAALRPMEFKQHQLNDMMRKAPRPVPRPWEKQKQQEPVFAQTSDLARMLGGRLRITVS
jgi:predicted amidophosphoribosyltransferase